MVERWRNIGRPSGRHKNEARMYRKIDKESIIEAYLKSELSARGVASLLGVDHKTVTGILKDNQIPLDTSRRATKYSYNKHVFVEPTEAASYWLGFIAADGSVDKDNRFNVSLHLSDVEHLRKLRRFLGSNHPIRKTDRLACFDIKSKALCGILRGLGIIENKSKFDFEINPSYLTRHFFRGLVDG